MFCASERRSEFTRYAAPRRVSSEGGETQRVSMSSSASGSDELEAATSPLASGKAQATDSFGPYAILLAFSPDHLPVGMKPRAARSAALAKPSGDIVMTAADRAFTVLRRITFRPAEREAAGRPQPRANGCVTTSCVDVSTDNARVACLTPDGPAIPHSFLTRRRQRELWLATS